MPYVHKIGAVHHRTPFVGFSMVIFAAMMALWPQLVGFLLPAASSKLASPVFSSTRLHPSDGTQIRPHVNFARVSSADGPPEIHINLTYIDVAIRQTDVFPGALKGIHMAAAGSAGLSRFPTQRQAKTDATAAFGKLVAAIVKCFGSVSGVNMGKFKHVWTAAHGLDKLDPADLVWEIVKVVNPGARGLGAIYITLKTTGQIIKITTALTPAGAGAMGTAYIVDKIAGELIKNC